MAPKQSTDARHVHFPNTKHKHRPSLPHPNLPKPQGDFYKVHLRKTDPRRVSSPRHDPPPPPPPHRHHHHQKHHEYHNPHTPNVHHHHHHSHPHPPTTWAPPPPPIQWFTPPPVQPRTFKLTQAYYNAPVAAHRVQQAEGRAESRVRSLQNFVRYKPNYSQCKSRR